MVFEDIFPPKTFVKTTCYSKIRSIYASPEDKIIFCIGRLVPEKGVQVLLDAMAAGTSVIVSDTGGLREIVIHNLNGLKCYPGNPNSLAEQINRLLEDNKLAQRLAKEGETLVIKNYTWAEIARQTKEVYREVLADYDSGSWKPSFFHSDSAGLYGRSRQLTRPGRYYVSADS